MSRRGAYTPSAVRGRGGISSVNGSHIARATPGGSTSHAPTRFAPSGGAGAGGSNGSSHRDGGRGAGGLNMSSALNIGAAPRIQLPSDPSRRIVDYASADDKCPQCKTDRYLNPKLKLLVSPCYHKLCESCLDRIFSLGPAPCPECGKTCRKNQFGVQTFQDLQVEREVDIRRRVGRLFNKREDDFDSLNRYNDYLEEVESITFNLINDIDVEETEKRIAAYLNSNKASIQSNVRSQEAESESQRAREESDKALRQERAKTRRERQERDAREKDADERAVVEALAGAKGIDVQAVVQQQQDNERKREQRREREEKEDEEAERRRELMLGSAAAGRKKGASTDTSGPPYHVESLWDFDGPLSSLDDSRQLFSLRAAPTLLGASQSKAGAGYDDPWITADLSKDEISRLRAGGYNWALAWQRDIRIAVEGIGIAPISDN